MHSLNHPDYGHAVQAARVEAAERAARAAGSKHPPPVRSRAAFAAGRLAQWLDSQAARRAVA
jgi:hypothetical protein